MLCVVWDETVLLKMDICVWVIVIHSLYYSIRKIWKNSIVFYQTTLHAHEIQYRLSRINILVLIYLKNLKNQRSICSTKLDDLLTVRFEVKKSYKIS